jgi:hypothetical protein
MPLMPPLMPQRLTLMRLTLLMLRLTLLMLLLICCARGRSYPAVTRNRARFE